MIVSFVDLIVEKISDKDTGAGALTAFRTTRLFRILKFARSKDLSILIKAINSTLQDLSYFSLLLILYIFTMSILGMELFAYKVKVNNITE